MTTSNSLSARYFATGLIASLATIVYLCLPRLEENRARLVSSLGITESALVLGVLIVIIAIFAILWLRFQQIASQPLIALIKQAETNRLNSGYSPKSKLMEVNRFRYLLENRSIMIEKMEAELEELEESNADYKTKLDTAEQKGSLAKAEIAEKSKLIKEMRFEQIRLEEAAKRLEANLEQERKAEVGVEIEKRSDEIYHQMERAVEASAYKAIWFPQIFQDLNTPASIISKTLENLDQNWESSSFARLKSDIETLREQSDHLLELLQRLAGDNPKTSKDSDERTDVIAEFPKPEASENEADGEDAINN